MLHTLNLSAASSANTEGDRRSKIVQLRELLAEKFPPAALAQTGARLATGVNALDSLTGGLQKAALTEIVGVDTSSGSGTTICALIESAQSTGQHLALVDGSNSFDPGSLSNKQLTALLWVQCSGPEQAMRVADLLLRDGNLPLVVIDLMMCPARQVHLIPSTSWYRLQRVTEGNGSTALIFTPTPVVASAACTLRLTRQFDLSALDLLREQITGDLDVEVTRSRKTQNAVYGWPMAELATG